MSEDPRAALLAWCVRTELDARDAADGGEGEWMYDVTVEDEIGCTVADPYGDAGFHIARHDPSSVLAQVAAVRAVATMHDGNEAGLVSCEQAGCSLDGEGDGCDSHEVPCCSECRRWTTDGDEGHALWPCPTMRALADGFTPGWRNGG